MEWSLVSLEPDSLKIEGTVSGSYEYETEIIFNNSDLIITKAQCSCPYSLGCKHIVALGLCFQNLLQAFDRAVESDFQQGQNDDSLHDRILRFSRDSFRGDNHFKKGEGNISEKDNERSQFLSKLKALGLPVEMMGEKMISELFFLKSQSADHSSTVPPTSLLPTNTAEVEKPVADLSEYYVRLDYRLDPQLCRKDSPYMSTSLKKILARSDLSSSQRELLECLKSKEFANENKERDLARLAELMEKSGIQASTQSYSYSYYYDFKPISFGVEKIAKLKAVLSYKARVRYDGAIRHTFILTMPETYWGRSSGYGYGTQKYLVAGGNHVAHVTDKKITLYPMPALLASIVGRVDTDYKYDDYFYIKGSASDRSRLAELTGEDVSRYEEIRRLAVQYLDLSEVPPEYEVIKGNDQTKSFVVEYDSKEERLNISAIIDYGSIKQDVAESVCVKNTKGVKSLAIREEWRVKDTHRIVVQNKTIQLAKIDEKAEISFFEEIRNNSETLGFTRSARCVMEGQSKILKYLKNTWPKLLTYADKHNYPVIFIKDKPKYEEAHFRADFKIDLDADNDWLYFDLDCYCGPDKLTLDQIRRFIQDGDTVFRKEDGTFLEITNRSELERLVTMLKSFEAKENGFEGKLYHATELQYVATSSKHYTSARAESFNSFLKSATSGKPVKPVKIPVSFDKVLRPYQKEGVHWLHFLRSFRFAGILADDMGLGKTIQALTILSDTSIPGRPSVVICPKSLLFNWQNEARMFAPHLKVLVYEGGPESRSSLARKFKKYDLIIVSYATFKTDESKFIIKNLRFNYVILDEAQFIKNHASKNAQITKKVNADYRLALTGTPLENNVSEIWSIFDFLMPGFLGKYEDFRKRFHKPIMDGGDRLALEHLRRKIAPFMLRRTKGEVLLDLPAKIEQEAICELGKDQNVLYQQILTKVKYEIFQTVKEKGFKNSQIHILAGLTKLRQVCNHPALLLEDKLKSWKKHPSAKLDLALELVDEAVNGGHKVLIFSQFTSMLDILANAFDEKSFTYLYLSGKSRNRQELVESFNNDPKVSVFLISLKAGGTGLNLTAADTVIIFDPWWNPSVEAQAADRAHRIGQKKTVNVYRLLTKGTIEEKIQSLKNKKKTLSDALVDSSGQLFNKLTWDDVRGLFE